MFLNDGVTLYCEAEKIMFVASYSDKRNKEMIVKSDPSLYLIKKALKKFDKHNINSFVLISSDGRCIKSTKSINTAIKWKKKDSIDNISYQYSETGEGYISVILNSGLELKRFYFK